MSFDLNNNFLRSSGRRCEQPRQITIETQVSVHAEGSCLIRCGKTHVICSATLDTGVPSFLRGLGSGWITAEYGMLPRSTSQRMKREAVLGKLTGRTQEIQRLIGRALRSVVDLRALGERQIIIDCDVINADGGTRTTAITGSYVALVMAVRKLLKKKILKVSPIIAQAAAISAGIYQGQGMVDLDYLEDSNAEVDANFILTSDGNLIEIQASAEKKLFSEGQLFQMLNLAKTGMLESFEAQNQALLTI